MDGVTLTWLRFSFALLVQSALLWLRRVPGLPWRHPPEDLRLMLGAAAGLVANFALFSVALQHLPASTAATITQLQPTLMLGLSVMLLRQRLDLRQSLGAATLVGGLALFLFDRLPRPDDLRGPEATGIVLCLAASLAWAGGGVAQKLVASRVPTMHVMWMVYAAGAACLAPFGTPSQLCAIEGPQVGLFAFLCLNTLLAYGAFALAVRLWELPRVSAVLSLTVVFTYLTEQLAGSLWPGLVRTEDWTLLKLLGAALVLVGSLVTAMSQAPQVVAPSHRRAA